MTVDFKSKNLNLILWRNIYKTYTLLSKCEDQIFSKHRLTTEQYRVLLAIQFLDKPVMVTDVARWLERSTNSISMIIDRMTKAGLVRRVRDRKDRRAVHLTITSKAENAFEPATESAWQSIQKIMSPLSNEDKGSFIILLNKLTWEASNHINPGTYTEEMIRNASKRHDN